MANRVIVVGAGISGLTAAYRLQQHGFDVTVLEASDHVGGKMASFRRDGFTLNGGATVISGSYGSLLGLARELGVEDQIVTVKPTIGIYAEREGQVHWIRRTEPEATVEDLIATPLLSPESKLLLARIVLDAGRARPLCDYHQPSLHAQLDTESVSQYCERRLNAEIRDRLIAPLITGLYLVDGTTVSAAGLFFSLFKLGGGLRGYHGGIDFITRALAERLHVETSTEVMLVQRSGDGARVEWTSDGGEHEERVHGVVLSVGAPLVLRIYPGLDSGVRATLEGLEHYNVLAVRFALSRRPDTDATFVIVPFGALGGIGLVIYEHSISLESAPPGKGAVGVMLGHDWITPRLERSDEELLAEVLPDLERIVPGIAGTIEFAQINRWLPVAVSASTGTQRRIAEIHERLDPGDRVQLAGDYLTIPGLEGSTVSGEAAARRLAAAIDG
jgi:protoporphyrinogen/coproporphyrinogen III oxidase